MGRMDGNYLESKFFFISLKMLKLLKDFKIQVLNVLLLKVTKKLTKFMSIHDKNIKKLETLP